MAIQKYPIYKNEEWIAKTDFGFRFALVKNRNFSDIEHCHDFYEIVTVFSGAVHHKINGQIYKQHSGDVCILRPGDCHLPVRITENISSCVASISAELVDSFLEAFSLTGRISEQENGVLYHIQPQQSQALLAAYEQMQSLSGAAKIDQGNIIISMLLQYYLMNQSSEQLNWIDRITREMNTPDNLAQGVVALQRISNLSHPQLCRVFKRILDQTPQQYIKELRLNYAYAMICNTNESFERIASMVGYASFSHFSSIFKRHFHQTPSSLRKTTIKYW